MSESPFTKTEPQLNIGLLGYGTVGRTVAELLDERDCGIRIRHILRRPGHADGPLMTDSFEAVLNDPEVTCIVEALPGRDPALSYIRAALAAGKHVVTSNKAAVAADLKGLAELARANNVSLLFEASCGGGMHWVEMIKKTARFNEVSDVSGILNGTCNYMLDHMERSGLSFEEALARAQALGYAEADPTGDIEGYDAANKAAIMATLGFHTSVTIDDVSVEGITKITADDIAAATAEHKVIKLLAVVENGEAGVSARVYPALIDENHPLASVHGSFNAVFVKAEAADDLMFYGRGAGGAPTASAVVGDVVTEARHIAAGCTGPSIPMYHELPKAPIGASRAAFAVRFLIHDKPGVLAAIAKEFADHGVSINGVNQDLKPTMTDPGYDGEIQQLRIVTHLTDEVTLRETVEAVRTLDFVTGEPSILRVLD